MFQISKILYMTKVHWFMHNCMLPWTEQFYTAGKNLFTNIVISILDSTYLILKLCACGILIWNKYMQLCRWIHPLRWQVVMFDQILATYMVQFLLAKKYLFIFYVKRTAAWKLLYIIILLALEIYKLYLKVSTKKNQTSYSSCIWITYVGYLKLFLHTKLFS